MASLPSFMTLATLLLVPNELISAVTRIGRSKPPTFPGGEPVPGSCREDLCISDYRGDGTDIDLCSLPTKGRLLKYCPKKEEYCIAELCEEKDECLNRGGHCVSSADDCLGRGIHGLCTGLECVCCLADGSDSLPDGVPTDNGTSICSGDLTLSTGESVIITSPNFPSNYDNNLSCTMLLNAPKYSIVEFAPYYFSLNECPGDILGMGDSTCLLAYFGTSFPSLLTMPDSTIGLNFRTDDSGTSAGFSIKVTAYDANDYCSGLDHYDVCSADSIAITSGVVIHSPDYPSNYPDKQNCSMTVTSPVNTTMSVTLLDVDINCPGDFLTFDTGLKSQTLCDDASCVKSTSENEASFEFFSDKKGNAKGFAICLQVV